MNTTMTALFGGAGTDWEFRTVPIPHPGPRQIVIRTRAMALNNADIMMLEQSYDPSTDTGTEYLTSAVVAATGDEGVDVVLDHVGGGSSSPS